MLRLFTAVTVVTEMPQCETTTGSNGAAWGWGSMGVGQHGREQYWKRIFCPAKKGPHQSTSTTSCTHQSVPPRNFEGWEVQAEFKLTKAAEVDPRKIAPPKATQEDIAQCMHWANTFARSLYTHTWADPSDGIHGCAYLTLSVKSPTELIQNQVHLSKISMPESHTGRSRGASTPGVQNRVRSWLSMASSTPVMGLL